MAFGSGKYTYEFVENWGKLPAGWRFGWIPAVACDSKDNVYVYSRSEHPLVLFDRAGNFLPSSTLRGRESCFAAISWWHPTSCFEMSSVTGSRPLRSSPLPCDRWPLERVRASKRSEALL